MRFNFCNDAEVVRARNFVWSLFAIYSIANVVHDIVRRMDRLFRRAKKESLSRHRIWTFVVLRDRNAFLFDPFWRATRYLCVNFTLPLCSTSSQFQRRGRKLQAVLTKSYGVCLNPRFTRCLTRRFTVVGENNREMLRHTP